MIKKHIFPVSLAISIVFTACSAQKSTSLKHVESQALEPASQKTITICLGEEPESLYLYSINSQAANLIFQAIYDGPIDIENGKPLPVILEKIPNFEDGSAFFTSIEVSEGDDVVNTAGDPVLLQAGLQVFPSGCTSPQCAVEWDGVSPLQMDYITAAYTLKPGLNWSDGQPLKASDSVYSFNLASDPVTPGYKDINEQLASYSAIDGLTVQWTGKPGFVTDAFENYFWTPLPEHVWGKYSTSEMLSADEVNRMPIGWGAYRIEEWVSGKSLKLSKNPNYFRAGEDLPYFDKLVFKFIGPYGDTALSNLKFDRTPFQQFNYDLGDFEKEISENGCDLATTTSDMRDQLPVLNILLNYFKDPAIKIIKSASFEDQLIVFNLREKAADASDPLLNLNVRKAVDLCLNRTKMISDLTFGLYGLVDLNLMMNPDKAPQNNAEDPYDPAAGKALLDQSGWKDEDNNPETPRISAGIPDVPDGRELGFGYLVEDIEDNLKTSEIVKASLAECGIGINIKAVPPEIFWDAMNADSVFQGNYGLAQFSWAAPLADPCPLFSSRSIPTAENNYFGINFSGFRNSDFDQACDQLEMTHLKSGRDALVEQMGTIINENLPMIPLYRYSKLMIAQMDFCDERLGLSSNNELSKIEEFKISPECK
jgi:peptide/nickel transport system substrate-binding protein